MIDLDRLFDDWDEMEYLDENDFKVGDLVICINNRFSNLDRNRVYKIKFIGGNVIDIGLSGFYNKRRFTLYKG